MPAKPRNSARAATANSDDAKAPDETPGATDPDTTADDGGGWVAVTDITVRRPDGPALEFTAGEPCEDAPPGWPPEWVVDHGYVTKPTTGNEGA